MQKGRAWVLPAPSTCLAPSMPQHSRAFNMWVGATETKSRSLCRFPSAAMWTPCMTVLAFLCYLPACTASPPRKDVHGSSLLLCDLIGTIHAAALPCALHVGWGDHQKSSNQEPVQVSQCMLLLPSINHCHRNPCKNFMLLPPYRMFPLPRRSAAHITQIMERGLCMGPPCSCNPLGTVCAALSCPPHNFEATL